MPLISILATCCSCHNTNRVDALARLSTLLFSYQIAVEDNLPNVLLLAENNKSLLSQITCFNCKTNVFSFTNKIFMAFFCGNLLSLHLRDKIKEEYYGHRETESLQIEK